MSLSRVAMRPGRTEDWKSPVYGLLVAQGIGYLLSTCKLDLSLGLNLRNPVWWQLVSSGFITTTPMHFTETIFLTYILGRLVERAYGLGGIWATYIAATLGEPVCRGKGR